MWLWFFLIFAIGHARGGCRLDPLVVTTQGLIKGLRTDDGYSMFLGIPYAKVDENNPFGPALSHPKFDAVFEAYNDPSPCPQMEKGQAIGSLDCLSLNIFVSNRASSSNKLPVIIWLHGGAFNVGYTTQHYYGAESLAKKDVIVVTLNYRLGPYGFFCLDTPEFPGNQGLKDQLIAMRWVKENIESFGGDATKITLMGESAGSVSAEIHLMSKEEKIFDKIILQSGTTVKPQAIINSNVTAPLSISEELGFKTEILSEALSFLSNADPKLVVAAGSKLSISLRPCVEREFENVQSIFTEDPYNSDIPKVRGMDILAGFNDREALMTDKNRPTDYFKNSEYFHNTLAQKFEYDDGFKEMEDIVRHFYIGDAELAEDVRSKIIDFEDDFFYNYPGQWIINRFLKIGARNIYQYLFSYDGGLNFIKNDLNITLKGAAHGDELGYLFEMTEDRAPSTEDQLVIDRMTTLWANFAKYGNPTPEVTELLPVTWAPITEDIINCLNIDSELSMITRPFSDRLAFWELFFIANQQRLKRYRHD